MVAEAKVSKMRKGTKVTWNHGKKVMTGKIISSRRFQDKGIQYTILSANGKKQYRRFDCVKAS